MTFSGMSLWRALRIMSTNTLSFGGGQEEKAILPFLELKVAIEPR